MVKLVKKISKGSRFNQIYLQKNEGVGFEPGKAVLISPLNEAIIKDEAIFEYNVKLSGLKKEIAKNIIKIAAEFGDYDNLIITGSFLEEGFCFEDVDIVIIDSKGMDKDKLENELKSVLGIEPHIILIDSESFSKGLRKDPLFRLMVDRFVSSKRSIFRIEKEINYRLLDAYLVKNKNLIDAYELFNIKQRKKLLRDFISIKLFAEEKDVTLKNVEKETERIFGKGVIEKLFFYGDNNAKQEFLARLKDEFKKLEKMVIENAAK